MVGGGIIGTSVLYHLAGAGMTDAVLLERDRISSGSTWHPAGQLATARGSHGLTEVALHSVAVYERLRAETGIDNGFNPRGSLALARDPDRLTELRYAAATARHHGIEPAVMS